MKPSPTTRVLSICGGGHSGSTLLDLLLGEHPQITSLGEVATLNRYLENPVNPCACGLPACDCPFWQAVMAEFDDGSAAAPARSPAGCDARLPDVFDPFGPVARRTVLASQRWPLDMRRSLAYSGSLKRQYALTGGWFQLPRTLLDTHRVLKKLAPDIMRRMQSVHRLFDTIRRQTGAQVIVDSSKHAYRMRLLHAARPDQVKCVFLVRDGRARAFSEISREGMSAENAAQRWVDVNRKTRRLMAALPTDAKHVLTYGDLCRDPEGTLAELCRFAGLPGSDRLLGMDFKDVHNLGGNRARFSRINGIREDERWRTDMDPADVATFERIGGSLNRELLGASYRA